MYAIANWKKFKDQPYMISEFLYTRISGANILLVWLVLLPFVMLYRAYERPKIIWLWIGGFFLPVFGDTEVLLFTFG